MPPTLFTPRLRLRAATVADAPAVAALWAVPDVRDGLWGGEEVTPAHARTALRQFERLHAVGLGLWVAEATGGADALLGCAGLRPEQLGGVEPLVAVVPQARRRGYAAEALQAVCVHALRALGHPELVAWVADSNRPARRLAAALGFTPSGQLAGAAESMHCLVLDAPRLRASPPGGAPPAPRG